MDTVGHIPSAIVIKSISGELLEASFLAGSTLFLYQEDIASCYVTIDKRPQHINIDAQVAEPEIYQNGSDFTVRLPRGKHTVQFFL